MLNGLITEIILISLTYSMFEVILPSGKLKDVSKFAAMIYILSFIVKKIILLFGGLGF